MDSSQQLTVPAEVVAQVLEEQRNEALNAMAQWKALALQFKATVDQLTTENEKLRADSGQPAAD
ncbi:hypothetical protein [Nonomuraea typhae]|uniref:Uncharacterized protein n=1 Tax=Nonomuraea typhae TaxID=2603600 RepID=A0ABW7YNK5_9ACTN